MCSRRTFFFCSTRALAFKETGPLKGILEYDIVHWSPVPGTPWESRAASCRSSCAVCYMCDSLEILLPRPGKQIPKEQDLFKGSKSEM